MKTGILCRFALLCCAVLSGGCSLLKVSVSEGDPLPRAEVRMRVMTRGFYHDLTAAVARTADSIADAAPDLRTRIGAVRWKMQVSSAAVGAAMQPIPEVALADTWILCRRMEEAFAAAPDSLLFGDLTPQARRTVRSLSERAGALARDVLSRDRYALMREFVDAYAAAHPITGDGAETPNTTLAWLTFLESRGADHTFASGSIAEVIADLGDRVDGRSRQLAETVGWSKDILEMRMEQDSTRSQLLRQIDSLDRNFRRMAAVMEHIPEISTFVAETFGERVGELIEAMDASVNHAFVQLDRQRDELQRYVSAERGELMRDVDRAAADTVRAALDGLPALVGKIVGWLVLLVVVVLGLPFAAGFWLGGLRERVRRRRAEERGE